MAAAMQLQPRRRPLLPLFPPLFFQRHHLHFGFIDSSDPSHHLSIPKKPSHPSPLSRFVQRIQAAYERIRFKNLPPQLRDVASLASTNAIRSESDLINVVEQRIWHSVIEGDFEKLPGQGKPLKIEGNPHADPAEDLAYRILSKNGFAPEWVELNKEIRFEMERWRRALQIAWKRKTTTLIGDVVMWEARWRADLKILAEELNQINKKVFHYNLIVPFGRQVFRYRLEEELQRVQNT